MVSEWLSLSETDQASQQPFLALRMSSSCLSRCRAGPQEDDGYFWAEIGIDGEYPIRGVLLDSFLSTLASILELMEMVAEWLSLFERQLKPPTGPACSPEFAGEMQTSFA